MYSLSGHPRCRGVWRIITSLIHQWMGAVRMRVQTADKKIITSSLNNPEPLNKLVSDKKKHLDGLVGTSNGCFMRKYKSWIRRETCIDEKKHGSKLKQPQWWICFLQTRRFWLLKMLINGLEWYRDVFNQLFGLSFWRHPFTAEDSLVSKWCNATISTNLFW